MPKYRQDPSIRFADVIKIWEAAQKDGGTTFQTFTDAETTTFIYRLNQYRKIIRDQSPAGWTDMDRFVVRRGEFTVTIEPRYVPDFSTRLRKLDGSPSTIYDQPKANPLDQAAKRLLDDPGEETTYTAEQQKLLREVQELQRKKGN